MSHFTDRETYLERAAEARAAAASTLLQNVRDRCLRSEAAWMEMAARAERTSSMQQSQLADKTRLAGAVPQ